MTTVPVKDPQVVKMNITTALSPIRNEFYISISFFIFLNYRTLPWTIEVSRDIPRLPTLDVLLDLQQQLNIFHETRPVQSVYPAIQWIGNGRTKFSCSSRVLDTESLSDLAVSSGELSSQMANYFIAKIQNLIPDSMFIYVGEFSRQDCKDFQY